MKHRPVKSARFFFATAPMPCPYLPGRVERRLVTELAGPQVTAFHDALSQAGFRRSHSIAYAPVCQNCSACAAVRIVAAAFQPSRGQNRVWLKNQDLIACETAPRATEEQYAVFRAYQRSRHGDSEMARMDFYDYQTLIEDTAVDTKVFEFRDSKGKLAAACLTDRLVDGFSAVYSFFDSNLSQRSLGTFMILWLVNHAKALERMHVYLGYWVADCAKMSYKSKFQPLEAYTPEGWRPLRPGDPETTRFFQTGH